MREPSCDFLSIVFSDLTILSALGVDVSESMWNPTNDNIKILSSLFDQVFTSFAGKPLYPTLIDKAANLLYLVSNDHKFENGNKRTAVVSMLILLAINDSWLSMSPDDLHELAVEVVKSKQSKNEVIQHIKSALQSSLITSTHVFTNDELAIITVQQGVSHERNRTQRP